MSQYTDEDSAAAILRARPCQDSASCNETLQSSSCTGNLSDCTVEIVVGSETNSVGDENSECSFNGEDSKPKLLVEPDLICTEAFSESDDSDISDTDYSLFKREVDAFFSAQTAAIVLYAREKEKKLDRDIRWRGPKDSIWTVQFKLLSGLRSRSNCFRLHELNESGDTRINKALRAVFYREYGANISISNIVRTTGNLYDVRRNLTVFNVVRALTQSHSACGLLHTMYEYRPSVNEYNSDLSTMNNTDAVTSYAGMLAYCNIKDAFRCSEKDPNTWKTPEDEDCITLQRNPMPEPLMLDLERYLGYARGQIPHDAGVWGILPLEVVRFNMWQCMYRLNASDKCTNIEHACCNSMPGFNKDTVFRALSVYNAMTAEYFVYTRQSYGVARDALEHSKMNFNLNEHDRAGLLGRCFSTEKRKNINSAFYASFHTAVQGFAMHYMEGLENLNEETVGKIIDATIQWYAEEWAIYRCKGCDAHDMGKGCYHDFVDENYDSESHLGAGGCATPDWIESVLSEIFDTVEAENTNEDTDGASRVTSTVMDKVLLKIKYFEY